MLTVTEKFLSFTKRTKVLTIIAKCIKLKIVFKADSVLFVFVERQSVLSVIGISCNFLKLVGYYK